MNKLLFTILLVFNTIVVFGQNHFTFKDVEINGTRQQVENQLIKKGFSRKSDKTLSGKFANKDCFLFASESDKTHCVTTIFIIFTDEYTTWSSLKRGFNEMVNLYTSKYGEPFRKKIEFDGIYEEGDGYELSAIKQGKATLGALWKSVDDGKGSISIFVMKDLTLAVTYTDNFNQEKANQADSSSAFDEI